MCSLRGMTIGETAMWRRYIAPTLNYGAVTSRPGGNHDVRSLQKWYDPSGYSDRYARAWEDGSGRPRCARRCLRKLRRVLPRQPRRARSVPAGRGRRCPQCRGGNPALRGVGHNIPDAERNAPRLASKRWTRTWGTRLEWGTRQPSTVAFSEGDHDGEPSTT